MISDTSMTPNNPEELKSLIEKLQSSHLAELEKLNNRHEEELRLLLASPKELNFVLRRKLS
jgi:hypothetical protein